VSEKIRSLYYLCIQGKGKNSLFFPLPNHYTTTEKIGNPLKAGHLY